MANTEPSKSNFEKQKKLEDRKKRDVAYREALVTQLCDIFCKENPDCNYNNLDSTVTNPLPHVQLENKAMGQIKIHPVVLNVLCGTIFGDSNLKVQKNYANARLQFRHSTRQTEWFMWKALCILKDFSSEKCIWFQHPDGFQFDTAIQEGETLGKLRYQSRVDSTLTAIWKIVCPGSKKTICRSWLNHMNNYFLMTLWLDDGSLSKGRQGVISCNSTSKNEANILACYITTVWGVKCNAVLVPTKITKTNPTPMAINIADFENLEKFIRIIAPIVPVKSMLYKVCLYKPNDPAFLQRWISELKNMVRAEWHSVIDERYVYLNAMLSSDFDVT